MGTLRRAFDGSQHTLSARTRVGRTADNELVCPDDQLSTSHAVIEWTTAGRWEVRDLGSTNGTFLSDQRLPPGRPVELTVGDTLAFAGPTHAWTLIDDCPPTAQATHLTTGERRTASDGMLLLSSTPDDWIEVVDTDGLWSAEMNGQAVPVSDGQLLTAGAGSWKLHLPAATSRTAAATADACPPLPSPREARLSFDVSRDWEHIRVTVSTAFEQWTSERAHNWVLLALARTRLREAERLDLDPEDHGWVYADELCTMVGIACESHLNVEVHRARKEMAAHRLATPAAIVERRRGTRQLRIGTPSIQITEGGGAHAS